MGFRCKTIKLARCVRMTVSMRGVPPPRTDVSIPANWVHPRLDTRPHRKRVVDEPDLAGGPASATHARFHCLAVNTGQNRLYCMPDYQAVEFR